MRRTKIVATLGPASSSPDQIRRLLEAGVDVFRLNFSHGTRDEHRDLVGRIREIGRELGKDAAVMQDLSGPKIRTGPMAGGSIALAPDAEVVITTEPVTGTADRFSTQYARLPDDVQPGASILLDDGKLELTVLERDARTVTCRVRRGGRLGSHKGINLPNTPVSAPTIGPKDEADLAVGIETEVDFVAVSFVRAAEDIQRVRQLLADGGSAAQVIAKIERPEAVENIDAITEAAHGILVARGDLGVEMDLARVPLLQKEIIRIANEQEKYVIVATQMLESMVTQARPTRAEVSDVTGAILDGTDAVMLSAETSVGAYPAASVSMMDRIARESEAFAARHPVSWDWKGTPVNPVNPIQDAIGRAAFVLSRDLQAQIIVAYSTTGGTALYLSKRRPEAVILVFTPNPDALRRMQLFHGVCPVLAPDVRSRDALMVRARAVLRERQLASAGDPVVMVTGTRFGQVGSTNSAEVFEC